MKISSFFLILFLSAAVAAVRAQQRDDGGLYTQPASVAKQGQDMREANRMGGNRSDNVRYRGSGSMSETRALQIARERIEPLYRELTRAEAKLLAVSPDEKKKFAEFLRLPRTGIIKLAPDFGCADNPAVVVASAECLKYSMPGGGSSYSFRVDSHRIGRLSDLTFTGGNFQSNSVLQHGMLVNLGDVSLEKVTLGARGLKFLTDFAPVADFEKSRQTDQELAAGVNRDGFLYRRALPAADDATFVLRSIAYRGTLYRAVQGLTYNEFDFDKREDVIIAFRIVERDADGAVTILWKELESKKSPRVKKAKDADLKEDKFVARNGFTQ